MRIPAFVPVLTVGTVFASHALSANAQAQGSGDTFARLGVNLIVKYLTDKTACIPAGYRIRIHTGADGKKSLYAYNWPHPAAGCDTPSTPLDPNQMYSVDDADLEGAIRNSNQIVAGALMVPIKYYRGGNHDVSGNAGIAGYLGREFYTYGMTLTPILFAGPSNISVTVTNSSGTQSTQSTVAFSYGLGLVGGFSDAPSVQYGFLVGWDKVGSSVSWENNGKHWLALSLGYKFF